MFFLNFGFFCGMIFFNILDFLSNFFSNFWYRTFSFSIQPEFSCFRRFFNSDYMNQSDTVIPDIDQSPSSIFCGIKKRRERENSGCSFVYSEHFEQILKIPN